VRPRRRIEARGGRRVGPGRALAAGYGLFVVASGSRSVVQLADDFARAPIAYLLSALAAVVYSAGAVCVVAADRPASGRGVAARTRLVQAVSVVELGGVLAVGVLSLTVDLGDDTVWGHFGQGYGFVPLVLPVCALGWARRRGDGLSAEPVPKTSATVRG
jgi:hypothetical protein